MKGSRKRTPGLLDYIPGQRIEVYTAKGHRYWIIPDHNTGMIRLAWGTKQASSGPKLLTEQSKEFKKLPPVWQSYCRKFWDAYQKLNYGL